MFNCAQLIDKLTFTKAKKFVYQYDMLLKMKLKIKSGKELVHSSDKSFELEVYRNKLIVNLNHRWSFKSFIQKKNRLIIVIGEGVIEGVFTGEVPTLSFQYQEKDQLVFDVILTNDLRVSK